MTTPKYMDEKDRADERHRITHSFTPRWATLWRDATATITCRTDARKNTHFDISEGERVIVCHAMNGVALITYIWDGAEINCTVPSIAFRKREAA